MGALGLAALDHQQQRQGDADGQRGQQVDRAFHDLAVDIGDAVGRGGGQHQQGALGHGAHGHVQGGAVGGLTAQSDGTAADILGRQGEGFAEGGGALGDAAAGGDQLTAGQGEGAAVALHRLVDQARGVAAGDHEGAGLVQGGGGGDVQAAGVTDRAGPGGAARGRRGLGGGFPVRAVVTACDGDHAGRADHGDGRGLAAGGAQGGLGGVHGRDRVALEHVGGGREARALGGQIGLDAAGDQAGLGRERRAAGLGRGLVLQALDAESGVDSQQQQRGQDGDADERLRRRLDGFGAHGRGRGRSGGRRPPVSR